MTETSLLRAIRAALVRDGRCRVVRNTVGYDPEAHARYGLGVGSPDLVGVLRSGRAFCIEVKTPAGRISRVQVAWWAAARRWGVTGGVARSVEEAMTLLDRAEATASRPPGLVSQAWDDHDWAACGLPPRLTTERPVR